MRNAVRIEFQRVIAVWLPVCGDATEIADPEFWLRLAAPDRSLPVVGVWQDLFSHWVPARRRYAESIASAVMQHETARVATDHHRRTDREASDLQDWIQKRADDLCGAFVPRTGDLFGAIADRPRWQLLSVPLDRLAAFSADDDNVATRRREAARVVELYQRSSMEHAARATLSSPILHPIGMLMLVPSAPNV
jgi:hypothetical protein